MALVSLFSSGALLFFGELYTSSNSGISKTRQSTVYSHRDDKGKLGAKQNRQQAIDSLDCVIGLFHAGSRVVLLLSSMRSEATCCLTENVFFSRRVELSSQLLRSFLLVETLHPAASPQKASS
jgi:hypothetical protein